MGFFHGNFFGYLSRATFRGIFQRHLHVHLSEASFREVPSFSETSCFFHYFPLSALRLPSYPRSIRPDAISLILSIQSVWSMRSDLINPSINPTRSDLSDPINPIRFDQSDSIRSIQFNPIRLLLSNPSDPSRIRSIWLDPISDPINPIRFD